MFVGKLLIVLCIQPVSITGLFLVSGTLGRPNMDLKPLYLAVTIQYRLCSQLSQSYGSVRKGDYTLI